MDTSKACQKTFLAIEDLIKVVEQCSVKAFYLTDETIAELRNVLAGSKTPTSENFGRQMEQVSVRGHPIFSAATRRSETGWVDGDWEIVELPSN